MVRASSLLVVLIYFNLSNESSQDDPFVGFVRDPVDTGGHRDCAEGVIPARVLPVTEIISEDPGGEVAQLVIFLFVLFNCFIF